jgi:hypothetical protein
MAGFGVGDERGEVEDERVAGDDIGEESVRGTGSGSEVAVGGEEGGVVEGKGKRSVSGRVGGAVDDVGEWQVCKEV